LSNFSAMEQLIFNLKEQIIDRLNLSDIKPEDINNDAPLFGDGLGLDSIDALEIIVLLQQVYGIKITNAEEGKKAMKSVKTLAEYITEKQA
jgi:acyl carrier protein